MRPKVRDLLENSPAYRSLPPDKRSHVAHDTVRVATYLVDRHRLTSQELASPVLAPNDPLTAVNFPSFVTGLSNGVFGAIVWLGSADELAHLRVQIHALGAAQAEKRAQSRAEDGTQASGSCLPAAGPPRSTTAPRMTTISPVAHCPCRSYRDSRKTINCRCSAPDNA